LGKPELRDFGFASSLSRSPELHNFKNSNRHGEGDGSSIWKWTMLWRILHWQYSSGLYVL
jgi:hypothetical protein